RRALRAVRPNDRWNWAELDEDGEDAAGIREPEQPLADQQVRRRRDRQELRESLDDAEERGDDKVHEGLRRTTLAGLAGGLARGSDRRGRRRLHRRASLPDDH